jgi:Mo-dependent nitrogenase C-terminus
MSVVSGTKEKNKSELKKKKPKTKLQIINQLVSIQFAYRRRNLTLYQELKLATLICRLIPATCPFARDVSFFMFHFTIPPLCKLNPLYDSFSMIRWECEMILSKYRELGYNFKTYF